MTQALIDIGSNSMRLTVYDISEEKRFKILFREKIMAGLAGYVNANTLSAEGIDCACGGLLAFQETLRALGIENIAVFATASLRNVANTDEAKDAIFSATGFSVDVISGEEEAMFGYTGAMQEVEVSSGAFMDIGGASTELTKFEGGVILSAASIPVGSLLLYRECVKKIMPGEGSIKRIHKAITDAFEQKDRFPFDERTPIVCAGGTARAALKLAKRMLDLPKGCRGMTVEQLAVLCSRFSQGDRESMEMILKLEPDRIHTIVPGLLIMQYVCKEFKTREILVCRYGVREGYLCQRLLPTMNTHKTVN